jgi:hypothetical protein
LVEVAADIDVEHMRRLARAHDELLAQWPDGIATLSVVREGVPVASTASRDESARFIKALGPSLRRTAMVLEGRGMISQLLTTVIRGINVVTRSQKLVIAPSIQEAVASVAPLVDGILPAQASSQLAEAMYALRAGYRMSAAAVAG